MHQYFLYHSINLLVAEHPIMRLNRHTTEPNKASNSWHKPFCQRNLSGPSQQHYIKSTQPIIIILVPKMILPMHNNCICVQLAAWWCPSYMHRYSSIWSGLLDHTLISVCIGIGMQIRGVVEKISGYGLGTTFVSSETNTISQYRLNWCWYHNQYAG